MDTPTRAARRTEDEPRPVTLRPDRPRGARASLILGLVALAAALAFPFAPVEQPRVEYTWPQAGSTSAVAVPLMPYQPVRLDASASCTALRAAGDGPALSTVPLAPDPTAASLPGLQLAVDGGALRVTTGGTTLDPVRLPAGDCTVGFVSDPDRTVVTVDGVPTATREGDVRPAVTGVFTAAPTTDGLLVRFTADTRFQTTVTPLKAGIGAVGVLAVLGMLLVLARHEGRARARLLPARWWRPRGPDVAVTATLAVWWIIGPVTVDDGYIAGIVRSRDTNGFIGNVYRWLNAPEAPFSWFYELYALWAQVSATTIWMRLPSVLLTLATWFLLSRLLLPRLLPRRSPATGPWTPWLAAAASLAWFLPFLPSMRPEPWVCLGLVAVFLAVERAVATRRLTPLAVGLLLAGMTTAVTPGGLMAFAPFLAAGVPVLRALRGRAGDLGRATVLVVLLAAPATAVFLMVYDQSLAAMLEGTRVRTLIGGGQPWFEEYTRYSELLDPGDILGPLARRLPILFTLLASAGVLWTLARRGTGLPAGPNRRIAVTLLLALAAMTVTPTKWTQHFGDVAGVGAAVLTVGLVAGSAAALRRRTASVVPALTGLGAVVVAGSLVLTGWNNWPYVSNWWGLTWSTMAPVIVGYPAAAIWLVAGLALLVALVLRAAWRLSTGRDADAPVWQPAPATPAVLLTVAVLALSVLSFAKTSVEHRDSYTLASDALSTLAGRPCGLQERLSVEPDPAAGLLPTAGPTIGLATRPVNVGGTTMPGVAVEGPGRTAWYRLDPRQRDGSLPVVLTSSGALRPGEQLTVEFANGAREVISEQSITPDGTTPTDSRLIAPRDAELVRLVTDGPGDRATAVTDPVTGTTTGDVPAGPGDAVVSLPRAPQLVPMTELLPPGTTALLDWPVAFVFPCLTPAPLPHGTASVPRWRVGPPQSNPAAGITYAPQFGGPFAGSRLLVTQQRMPTYLDADPTRDAAQLYRWTPVTPLAPATPQVTSEVVSGVAQTGKARVPGLDFPR